MAADATAAAPALREVAVPAVRRSALRTRTLFILVWAVAGAATLVAAGAAVGFALRAELAGILTDARIRDAVEAARLALLGAGGLALVAVLPLALRFAGRATAGLQRLRSDLAVMGRGGELGRAPLVGVHEVDVAAGVLEHAARDLAARHDALRRERDDLELLIDAVSEGIIRLDGEGRVLRTNDAARALLRMPAPVEGRPVSAFVRYGELRRVLEAAAAGAAADPCEVVVEGRQVVVMARPVRGGEAAGAVAVLVDLTELRRLEGVRRDFVANASHELKTPLTSIRGYTETLLAEELPPAIARQFLTTVHENAARLQRIVEDLLDLTRLESGGWRHESQPLDPVASAREAWDGLDARARAAGVAFRVEGEGGLRVIADPAGLAQAFTNLFDNAIRYTPSGGVVSVRTVHAGGGAARPPHVRDGKGLAPGVGGEIGGIDELAIIEVRDTGSGIPGDALGRIFERFYRVDPARSRREGGTGLGLSIVKHLIESMGGDVTAESDVGKGTLIRLRLPAAPPAAAEASTVEP
jgi:two-component system, OmpR family, phosphate regulon sensor histidine kinase PhoR